MKIVDAKASKRTAVSPVIATLLLIAIAVAAGILVYVFVNGLATNLTGGGGQQVASQLSEDAYSSTLNSQVAGNSTVLMTLRNVGGGSATVSAVYFDGTALTQKVAGALTMNSQATQGLILANSFTTSGANSAREFYGSPLASLTSGSSHVVRIILSNGAQFSFTVVAGSTG